jgi:hypothetical protein
MIGFFIGLLVGGSLGCLFVGIVAFNRNTEDTPATSNTQAVGL